MRYFLLCLKRRLFHKHILFSLIVSLLIMIISFAVKSSPEIEAYYQVKTGNHPLIAQLSEIYEHEAANRFMLDYQMMAKSQAFSFFIFMENGFTIYHFLANFLITLPVLLYMDDRKNRVVQQLSITNGHQTIMIAEALTASISAFIIVLVPSIIFWLITWFVSSSPFPLSQQFGPYYDSMFQVLGQEQNVVWLYLVLIILVSFAYFFRGLLAFAITMLTSKKAIIIFVPILFVYARYIIFSILHIEKYGELSYYDPQIKAIAPMLCSYLVAVGVTAILLYRDGTKERFVND